MSKRMNSCRRALIATAAAGVCCIGAMPAHAALTWVLTINNVVIFTVVDGGANDINPAANAIEVNAAAANAVLIGLGSEYRLTSAGANSNCGNPAGCLGALNLANINSSAIIQNTGSGGILDIEVSQDNWLVPVGNPRTLVNAPAATLTLLTAPGDNMDSTGYNNPNNILFSTAAAFNTPTSLFTPGNVHCSASVGGVSSCSDLTTRPGIVEGNPFSLTQVMNFNLTNNQVPRTISYTDASTKFQVVPEPMSVMLVGLALAGLGVTRRRSKS